LTTFLLDVNVLIALLDPAQVQHDAAHECGLRSGVRGLGDLSAHRERRAAHRRAQPVPQLARHTGGGAAIDGHAVGLPGHAFWPDDISLLDAERIAASWPLSTAAWSPTPCWAVRLNPIPSTLCMRRAPAMGMLRPLRPGARFRR
jgi:hypothetical protein